MKDLSSYAFQPLRDDRTLLRGTGPSLDPILLAVQVGDTTSRESLDRLEHEYELRHKLEGAWVVRPTELAMRDGRITLVLEDPGGVPLDRLLGQPLNVKDFLRLAIPLVGALRQIHDRDLIHKDISPANVFVDIEAGRAWLTGFGIASHVSREPHPAQLPDVIAGTLAYMAPEQTGRMNRAVDVRSDLYALGVTFYRMLTGALPFVASDPMEWAHAHVAKQPTAVGDRVSVPAPISAIVMKLLAKGPEERYQSAAGLEADLQRCEAEWEAYGRIGPFPIGVRDRSDRLLVPETLFGREDEIAALCSSFDRVADKGAPELVLVSGYSGIGKSSVVHEVRKAFIASRVVFASGKADQYNRETPYTTIREAFQDLTQSLLSSSEDELQRWRESLREALGSNAQLIVNVIPELELVIGSQPDVAELPAQDAKRRFQAACRNFLNVFARRGHPLVLFLDDLQWADGATLDLLEHLVTHPEVRHLLLVGAYRDNEVGSAHPLRRTLDAIGEADGNITRIVLPPLRSQDVGRLVAAVLQSDPDRTSPLAQLVHGRTGGNPFFATQFITALAEEGTLSFDSQALAWQWDIERLRARSYTDNVVDLMADKLRRLSEPAQEILKRLACAGNVAEFDMMKAVHGEDSETTDAALREAVHAGLVVRLESAYQFLHDRIQEAAYSLIPEADRAEAHVRLGRAMLANMGPDGLAKHVFDVASHFNKGAVLVIDREERAQVAAVNLRAARRARASTDYLAACAYLAAGMSFLDEDDWGNRYELTFSLWLERAQCEMLASNFEMAEQVIAELLRRGASKVDQAEASCLKVRVHEVKGDYPQAVDSALACLRLFDMDLPAHPTEEQVKEEYDALRRSLQQRPIDELIDLPLMADPALQAAMQLLSALLEAAYFTDVQLYALLLCRMANVSNAHGTSGASAYGYGLLGPLIRHVFQRNDEAYRFTKLACDLVEKHRFTGYQARVYFSMGLLAPWTQPMATAISFNQAAFRIGSETGDLAHACYGIDQAVMGMLLKNEPLDAAWRESERGWEFTRKAGHLHNADVFVSQQRFIAAMQGRTARTSDRDGAADESAFEAELMERGLSTTICLHWILTLKARFLSGEFAQALAAAEKARASLDALAAQMIGPLEYCYYTSLTLAALFRAASPEEQALWRERLVTNREQLRAWFQDNPSTFGDKHALVAAEIARLEGHDADAMRLYDRAVRLARENGFVQNEGTAYEVGARFYAARGLETIAHAYLRNARYCYLRWGANAQVQRLEQTYPFLREVQLGPGRAVTIGEPIERLELATAIKVSEAVSGEIVMERLMVTVMRTAIEQAGAERGVLILQHDGEKRLVAEAITSADSVDVRLMDEPISPALLPEAIVHYVARTKDGVILDDASVQNAFSADPYIRDHHARSMLCVPLTNRAKLIGVLYLENNLSSHVFTPARAGVLRMLASQAAISLENTRLYADLAAREAKVRRLVEANIIGICIWNQAGEVIEANDAFLNILNYSRDDLSSGRVRWMEMMPPEWLSANRTAVSERTASASVQPFELEVLRKDGTRVPILLGSARFERTSEGVAFVLDLSDLKRAEQAARESERRNHDTQVQLAHANRVATAGQMSASIAHELNQPLSGIITNAGTCLRMLAADPPNIDGASETARRTIRDGNRAAAVITRLRALFAKHQTESEWVDLNEAARDVIALSLDELQRNGVAVDSELAPDLPRVMGDRVQLQQVILNLMRNASDAMNGIEGRPKQLVIRTERDDQQGVRLSVRDNGTGFDRETADKLFEPFYTTKDSGMGIGLSVSRSIIERHQGSLSAAPNDGPGVTFSFSIPVEAGV